MVIVMRGCLAVLYLKIRTVMVKSLLPSDFLILSVAIKVSPSDFHSVVNSAETAPSGVW